MNNVMPITEISIFLLYDNQYALILIYLEIHSL